MAAAADTTRKPSSAPASDYQFDGSNWQDLTRLIALAKLHRASGTEVDSDTTQSAWVARQFTGPALDLVANLLVTEAALFDNFNQFCARVRDYFGITDTLLQAHQRTQLDALKWHRDLPLFFAEFERLSHACGMGGENAGKVTLLVSKIPEKQRAILARQAPPPSTFSEYRSRLLTVWVADPTSVGVSIDKEQARPKCGKCGKKGHTTSTCHSVTVKTEKA
jgi:hypothetical protein